MSKATTVRLDAGLEALISAAADESIRTPEIPEIKQSEIIRILLRTGAEELLEGELDRERLENESLELEPDRLPDLIPDHKLAKYYRERRKDEGWYVDMKAGFQGRVRDQLGTRFRRGYSPGGIEKRAESFIAEAWDYWGRIEENPDKAQEMCDYVKDTVAELQRKHSTLDFNPHEEWLEELEESVTDDETEERERATEQLNWQILEDARERVIDGRTSTRAIETTLANKFGIDSKAAETAIELVRPETVGELEDARGTAPSSEQQETPEGDISDSGVITGGDAGTVVDHSADRAEPDPELIEHVEHRLEEREPVRVDEMDAPEHEARAAIERAEQRLIERQRGATDD